MAEKKTAPTTAGMIAGLAGLTFLLSAVIAVIGRLLDQGGPLHNARLIGLIATAVLLVLAGAVALRDKRRNRTPA